MEAARMAAPCQDARMRILVTNDDGIDAIGLHVLTRALGELDGDHEIVVVAPDREFSGSGASLGALPMPISSATAGAEAVAGLCSIRWSRAPSTAL